MKLNIMCVNLLFIIQSRHVYVVPHCKQLGFTWNEKVLFCANHVQPSLLPDFIEHLWCDV